MAKWIESLQAWDFFGISKTQFMKSFTKGGVTQEPDDIADHGIDKGYAKEVAAPENKDEANEVANKTIAKRGSKDARWDEAAEKMANT